MDTIPAVQGQYFPSMPSSPTATSRFLDPGYGPPPPLRRLPAPKTVAPWQISYPPQMTLPGIPPTPPDTYTPKINIPQINIKAPIIAPATHPQLAGGQTAGIAYGDSKSNPFLQSDINNVMTKLSYLQYNVNESRYAIDWMYDRILVMRSWNNQMQYNLNDAQSALRTLAGRY